MTKFFTGISGITKYSPAFTINNTKQEIVYNYFINHQYKLVQNKLKDFYQTPVEESNINIAPSLLPPKIDLNNSLVERLLRNKYENMQVAIDKKPYRPKFKLDYISNTGMGIGSSTMYGTGLMGGVSMIFSDILGQHQLYTAASLNGEVYDFAAMGAYFNQKHRIGWGGSLSHIPYTNYFQGVTRETIEIGGNPIEVDNYKVYILRMFEEKVGLFASYPFSKTMRAELGGSLAHYSYKITSNNYYFDYFDPYTGYSSGYYGYERKDEKTPPGFNFHELNTAFVGDNSVFGMTAPMKGQRYRVGIQQYFGKQTLSTFNLDYRKYIFVKPITFAFKFSHLNRFGPDSKQTYMNGGILPPLYLGYDFYVRGYSYTAMYESAMIDPSSLWYNDLMGSKMLLSNFEIRLPFTGPERLALIKSGILFSDINLFVDAGLIWNGGDQLALKKDAHNRNVRYPIFSTGISSRINLFGQIIIQPYYAFPLSLKTGSKGYFGINFYPGF